MIYSKVNTTILTKFVCDPKLIEKDNIFNKIVLSLTKILNPFNITVYTKQNEFSKYIIKAVLDDGKHDKIYTEKIIDEEMLLFISKTPECLDGVLDDMSVHLIKEFINFINKV